MPDDLIYFDATMNRTHHHSPTVIVEEVSHSVSPVAAVVSFARQRSPAILESSLFDGDFGRFSILACDPIDRFVFDPSQTGDPVEAFVEHTQRYPTVRHADSALPFPGGWIGFLAYEGGARLPANGPPVGSRRFERPRRAVGDRMVALEAVDTPLADFRLYDAAAIHDRLWDRWYVVAVDWRGTRRGATPVRERLRHLQALLRMADAQPAQPAPPACEPNGVAGQRGHGATSPIVASSPLRFNMSRSVYLAKVEQALRYIAAGDIYQVNLTQRFETTTDASPLDLYLALRAINPSSHAAFLPWATAVISSSPELFLELHNDRVVTRPIKGTRPRGHDRDHDASLKQELADSAKDAAELNMIVDLLRNDLGRVCTPGTVDVCDAGRIETLPAVFHRVATIRGTLSAGRRWGDVLAATFPGGSVTGAPKIRAMQIIDALEPTPRGVYCGSIGYVGLDGAMAMNIAIRTMVQRGRRVRLYAGGAIVADSDPEQEYAETLVKASAMLRVLGCDVPRDGEASAPCAGGKVVAPVGQP